jgi:hypothetical protein
MADNRNATASDSTRSARQHRHKVEEGITNRKSYFHPRPQLSRVRILDGEVEVNNRNLCLTSLKQTAGELQILALHRERLPNSAAAAELKIGVTSRLMN